MVVIGILIALQINTWNQQRLNAKEEQQLLSNLNDEFLENKVLIDDLREIIMTSMNSSEIIIKLMGSPSSELQKHNLDSIFYKSLPAYQFISTDQSISNILQGGKMNIVQNERIIKLLYKWQAQVKILNQREQSTDSWLNMELIPYLAKYISFREMDSYGNHSWSGTSKLKKDYYPLFQSLEFENFLDNTLFMSQVYIDELDKANVIASEIIAITQVYKGD